MNGNNGITKAQNGTFYVANAMRGGLSVLEEQADNTLVLLDVIPTGILLVFKLRPLVTRTRSRNGQCFYRLEGICVGGW